jgi:hypothetical protein
LLAPGLSKNPKVEGQSVAWLMMKPKGAIFSRKMDLEEL